MIDETINDKTGDIGYFMGRNSVKLICYADDADMVIVLKDEGDVQRMSCKFKRTEKKFLIISVLKTKYLTKILIV